MHSTQPMRFDKPMHANYFMLFLLIYLVASQVATELVFAFFSINLSLAVKIIISQTVGFILPILVIGFVYRKDAKNIFPFRNPGLYNLFLVLVLCLLAQPVMMFCSALSMFFFPNTISTALDELFLNKNFWVSFAAIAVTPAICEELAFRGVIMAGYRRPSLLVCGLMSGFYFGLIHMNPQQFLYAFLLGIVFAYFVRVTNSLIPSMMAHFFINASQYVLSFAAKKFEENNPTLETMELPAFLENNPTAYSAIFFAGVSLFALPLFFLLFRHFLKYNKSRNLELLNEKNATKEIELTKEDETLSNKNFYPNIFNGVFVAILVVYFLLVAIAYVPAIVFDLGV